MKRKNLLATISLSIAMSFASSSVLAKDPVYEVTITNLTKNIIFTPILVVSHRKGINLFKPGDFASSELESIAEGGDTAPMTTLLEDDSKVIDVVNSGGPLTPGDSVTVEVDATKGAKYISMASMMLPTNDGFIALNGVKAPHGKASVIYHSPGYDAGTEANDELCIHIPGPQCTIINGGVEGEAFSAPDATDESYVHIHSGIQSVGDLAPGIYAWLNPVALISIQRK